MKPGIIMFICTMLLYACGGTEGEGKKAKNDEKENRTASAETSG